MTSTFQSLTNGCDISLSHLLFTDLSLTPHGLVNQTRLEPTKGNEKRQGEWSDGGGEPLTDIKIYQWQLRYFHYSQVYLFPQFIFTHNIDACVTVDYTISCIPNGIKFFPIVFFYLPSKIWKHHAKFEEHFLIILLLQ